MPADRPPPPSVVPVPEPANPEYQDYWAVWDAAGELVHWNPPKGYPGEPGCTCWNRVDEFAAGGYVSWPHMPWVSPPVTRWEPRTDPNCRTHRKEQPR